MHADDAQHLYVDVAAPLAARALLSLTAAGEDDSGRLPRRPRRVAGPQRQRGRGRAGETGPLRLPHRRRLRQPRRGRARPLRPRPPRRPPARGRPGLPRARPLLRRGAPARGLRQPRAEARRLPLPPPRPPPPRRGARSRRRQGPARLRRTAGRRLRRPRGPRRRPLRRLRDPRGRRRHPRLPLPRIQGRGPRLRPHRPAGEAESLRRRRRRPDALGAGRQTLAEPEGAGPQGGRRPGRRAAQPLRRAPLPPRPRLSPRRRVADRHGAGLPLPRDRRPAGGDRGGQGGHGVRAPDGPAGLRRRRLRQDRGGAARGGQGGLRRQAGDGPGADDDPRPAALRHLPRAPRRPPVPGRGRLPAAARRRDQSGPQGLRGGQGRRPDRHPPPALPRRPRQGAGTGRRRRGAALRGQAEGAAAPAEAEGRRAGALGDADPAHPADEPRRAARHLGDRDPARGPAPGPHLRRPLRRGPGPQGDRARGRARAARPSSSTTGSTRCRRPRSACAAWSPAPASSKPTGRWTSTRWRRRC